MMQLAFEILAEAKIRRFFEEKRARGLRPFFDPALALPWAWVSRAYFPALGVNIMRPRSLALKSISVPFSSDMLIGFNISFLIRRFDLVAASSQSVRRLRYGLVLDN
jgi:hypothetical protein